MSGVRHIEVKESDDGQRLDRWLKQYVPFRLAQKLIRTGQVRVDGKRAKMDTRIYAGQDIRLPPIREKDDTPKKRALTQQDVDFIKSLVLYDDGDVAVLNKPQGLATQGGTGQKNHIDGLLEGLKHKDLVPRLIHRLDKDTSGILITARKPESVRRLGKSFKRRDVRKIYWALVAPAPDMNEGEISAPLNKVKGLHKDKMVLDQEEGKAAVTDFAVIDRAGKKAAFVAFWPRTGRTHQIRVHAAEMLGCPVLGDHKYGSTLEGFEGVDVSNVMHLHARRLVVPHPQSKDMIDVTAPLPEKMQHSWAAFGFDTDYRDDPFERG